MYQGNYPPQQQPYPPQQQHYNQQPYPPQQQYNQQPYPPQQGYSPQPAYPPPQPAQQFHTPPVYDAQPNNFTTSADTGEKFKAKPGFNDVWAALLFFAHLAIVIVLAFMSSKNIDFSEFKAKDDGFGTIDVMAGLLVAGLTSGVLSLLYLILLQKAARILIIISFWFSVLMNVLFSVFCFSKKQIPAGVIFLIFAALGVYVWFSWKSRIPLATLMLKNVAKFTQRYPGTTLVGFLFMLISIGYVLIWAFTLVGSIKTFGGDDCKGNNQKGCNNGASYAIFVYLAFSLFWVNQLLQDLCHMTVSGAFASDYFFPSTTSTASRFTSFSSLGRALTTSFGSACFGSLLVAILRTLKFLARQARQESDNMALAFLACCAECILAQIEALVEYFNRYAYCYCAMYGLPYLEAGKSTWNLIKDRGVDALVNDSLIGNVLSLGCFVMSLLACAAGLLAGYAMGAELDSYEWGAFGFFAFFIGLLISSVVSSVIESANNAFFVCLAEDPQALATYNPELFEKIRQTYPEVITPV